MPPVWPGRQTSLPPTARKRMAANGCKSRKRCCNRCGACIRDRLKGVWCQEFCPTVRRLNEWGKKLGSGPPSPKVVPLQEPLVFHNDFSRGTVALHASGMNRTKVPVHVSKVLRTSPEIVSWTTLPGHGRAGFAPCRIRANWWRR